MLWQRIITACGLLLLLVGAAQGAERAVLRAALNSITAADLQTHVDVLADDSFEGREAGSRGGRAAGVYLAKHLEKQGLQGAGDDGGFFQPFGNGYRNVLALVEGSDPQLKHEIVLVGAHYDHVGYGNRGNSYGPVGYVHNGADDNASGVAGLLETIDACGQLASAPRRSILFAFWDGEEKGLLGSKHWLAQPTVPLERVGMAINIDMIGRMQKERLQVFGTRTASGLRRLVSECNLESEIRLDFNWEMRSNSDHFSFFTHEIPVLMFHTGIHDDYHRPSDDAHLVNSAGMQQAARLLAHVVFALAQRNEAAAFRGESRRESRGAEQLLEQAIPPMPPRLGIRWEPATADGLVLTDVRPGTPAAAAGWTPGDRILQFDGKKVTDEDAFRRTVLAADSSVEVLVQKQNEGTVAYRIRLDGEPTRIGVSWRDDAAEPGTVILTRVIPASPADAAGLQTRDRIYEVQGRRFADSTQLYEMLTSLPGPISVTFEREGRLKTIQLVVPPAGS